MAKDFGATAEQLLRAVGGKDNIAALVYCMTRLRFTLRKEKLVDLKELENIPHVLGVLSSGGQLQVIIGNDVAACYAALMRLRDFEVTGITGSRRNIFVVAIDFVSGCMTAIVPAIIAGGLLKVVLMLLGPTITGLLSETSTTYRILNIFAEAVIYFLPVLLAYAAARKLNTSIPIAITLGGVLIHPNLFALLGSDRAITLFGIPVFAATYSSSIVPILLTVILLKYVEKLVDRITPVWGKNFLKPLLILVITAPLSLLLAAPLGSMISVGLAWLMDFLFGLFPPIVMGLIAGFMPFLVMTGMHYAFLPAVLGPLGANGYDYMLLPAMFASNTAQGAAALATAIKSKKPAVREVGISAAISALVAGVTEPAMNRITLKYRRIMIAPCVGSAVGGVIMGIAGTKAFAFSIPSLLSSVSMTPTMAGYDHNLAIGLIAVFVSMVISFILTLALYKDTAESRVGSGAERVITVLSPLAGWIVPIESINDPTFSTEVLGKGYAVLPYQGMVKAPFDGRVDKMFDTGHALGLVSDDGVEMLIHIGVDTVELGGKFFTPRVKTGDTVTAGQPVLEFNVEGLMQAGYDITSPVIISNVDAYAHVSVLRKSGEVQFMQPGFELM